MSDQARAGKACIELHDAEACIRLIRGVSLPADMQPFREGLLTRLRDAIEEGARWRESP